jgi:hypothetical protein
MPEVPQEWAAVQSPGDERRGRLLQAPGTADIERRRQAQYTLPPLVDLATVQRAIGEVAQALAQDRIDEDYAGELLHKLEKASLVLRGR